MKVSHFSKPNNVTYKDDTITITPTDISYKGDTLVAVCNIYNGFSKDCYDLEVPEFTLSNDEGVIATASFGNLTDKAKKPLAIPAKKTVSYTFIFPKSAISQKDADFSILNYKSNVGYRQR